VVGEVATMTKRKNERYPQDLRITQPNMKLSSQPISLHAVEVEDVPDMPVGEVEEVDKQHLRLHVRPSDERSVDS
jgi:hypothetical protein